MRPSSGPARTVSPLPGEQLVKHEPNSFRGTVLEELLRRAGVTERVIAGMMSSMCVDSTTRAAHELGRPVTVVHDACAAPDLGFGTTMFPGASVHASFMAALDGSFATVLSSTELR